MLEAVRRVTKHALQKQRLSPYRFRIPAGASRSVLLTFDDGPDPVATRHVLDRLDKFGARALFFVVGSRIHKAPELLGEILARGHWIGNHTHTHPLDRKMSPLEYVHDVGRCQSVLHWLTNQPPKFFRPPQRMSTRGLVAARAHELVTVHWSLDSHDWRLRDTHDAHARGRAIAPAVRPGEIVLFHDDNPHTPELLDVLLPELRARDLDLSFGLERLASM